MESRGDLNRRNLARAFYQRACEDREVARILLKEGNMQILHYTRSNAVKRRSNHFWLFRTGFSHLTLFRENFP